MKKVIFCTGKAEHGKSTAAKIIKDRLEKQGCRVVIIPFADYLKFIAERYFGWNGKKDEAGRELLQVLGTDKVRKRNMDFWVRAVYQLVEIFWDEFDYVICDDTRFPNEIEYFRSNNVETFVLRVIRPNHVSKLTAEQLQHLSETALDNFPHDMYLYAGTGDLSFAIDRNWDTIWSNLA